MKSMDPGDILKSKVVSPIECLQYALNLPTSLVINGIESMELLDHAFEAARTFKPLTQNEVATLLAKTAQPAANGEYERFKTSHAYDSTERNPSYLN